MFLLFIISAFHVWSHSPLDCSWDLLCGHDYHLLRQNEKELIDLPHWHFKERTISCSTQGVMNSFVRVCIICAAFLFAIETFLWWFGCHDRCVHYTIVWAVLLCFRAKTENNKFSFPTWKDESNCNFRLATVETAHVRYGYHIGCLIFLLNASN